MLLLSGLVGIGVGLLCRYGEFLDTMVALVGGAFSSSQTLVVAALVWIVCSWFLLSLGLLIREVLGRVTLFFLL